MPEGNVLVESLVFWTMTYPAGMLLVFLVLDFVLDGLIEIRGWDKFPHGEGGVLLVPNHPSLLEPFIMIALFIWAMLINPRKFGPYTVADDNNFVNSPLCWVVKSRLLPINRAKEKTPEATRQNALTVLRGAEILNNGGNVIIFGEGGRTFKAENILTSDKGCQMGRLDNGVAVLILRGKPKTVPIWIDIAWLWKVRVGKKTYRFPKKIKVNIGESIRFEKGVRGNEMLDTLQIALLKLGDELKPS